MGRLILSNLGERYAEATQRITALVLNDPRLGDPRLPLAQANWRNMPSGARERVLSWLAKETIEFFFNAIVPKSDENRRRADFWLRYAMKPGNIKDFQVALSSDDARLLRHRSLERVAYPELEDAKTSAFMMQFEGYDGKQYVIVEFSETGNAAYIYDRQLLPSALLSFRSQRFTISQLRKAIGKYDRIIHNGDWETKAASLLYEQGIRP
jgi:EH_Signature domain